MESDHVPPAPVRLLRILSLWIRTVELAASYGDAEGIGLHLKVTLPRFHIEGLSYVEPPAFLPRKILCDIQEEN